jgi:hypothetical protein
MNTLALPALNADLHADRQTALRPAWTLRTPQRTTVAHCLLLALLLHVWLVLLVGSAPSGTARDGEAVGGSLNVRLGLPAATPATVAITDVPPPAVAIGPVGQAPEARWGGAVRDREPPPADEPGTARLGTWAAQATGAAAQPALPFVPPMAAAIPLQPALPSLAAPLTAAAPTLAAPQDMNRAIAAPQAALRSSVLPAAAPAALPALPTPPVLQATPTPQAATQTLSSSVTQPALASPVAPLGGNPRASADTVQLPTSAALKAAPTALAPAELVPETAPGAAAATGTVAAPTTTPAVKAGPNAVASPNPAAAPDAGTRLGFDVATPPAKATSAPARLNLDLPKPSRGGELSRMAAPGVWQLLPRPPDVPNKLARDVKEAGREDCTKAHADKGLIAVIPLVVDTLKKEGGCKW